MKWTTVGNYEEMSQFGARRIFGVIKSRVDAGKTVAIGLATGNTMIRLYELLAQFLNESRVNLSGLTTFNLDEYATVDNQAVSHDHPLSYYSYMWTNLFSRFDPSLGFRPENARFPQPVNSASYDDDIAAAGGLDLQLLGIGFNGHIAFNEPMDPSEISVEDFAKLPTRLIDLKEATIQQNSRLTAGNQRSLVPVKAITMGMKPILEAKECLLLACFAEQEGPLGTMKKGTMTPALPASYLLGHPNSEIVYTTDKITL